MLLAEEHALTVAELLRQQLSAEFAASGEHPPVSLSFFFSFSPASIVVRSWWPSFPSVPLCRQVDVFWHCPDCVRAVPTVNGTVRLQVSDMCVGNQKI